MRLPQPFQYQGSKRGLAPIILNFLPESKRLVEPFAGSAAISVASAARRRAGAYWLNDCNKPLAELLDKMIHFPDEVADFYEKTWRNHNEITLDHYYTVRETFNRTRDSRLLLYLLARCVKGAVRYNSEGLFNQSPDKRRLGTHPDTMRDNIMGFSTLLKGKTTVTGSDYREVLAETESVRDLVYMDPPYQGVCGERDSRYYGGISFANFVDELHELNRRDICYVISYDGRMGSRIYGEILPDHLKLTRIEIEAGRSTQATLLGRDEVTVESLYLSANVARQLDGLMPFQDKRKSEQMRLLEEASPYGRVF